MTPATARPETARPVNALPRFVLEPLVRAALTEDLGRLGDITSQALIGADVQAQARLTARQEGVLAGLDAALLAFRLMDSQVCIEAAAADGERLPAGALVALVEGNARAILAAERTALNFLARLSGIATATATAVAAAGGKALVCGTRKTAPGLRVLEKHAVALGGGETHRLGLDDAMLIKDNHLALLRHSGGDGVPAALKAAQSAGGSLSGVEIEVDDLRQLEAALQAGAGRILLDNMTTEQLAEAVKITAGRALLEASGGISLARVAEVAGTGVDFISLGALTQSAAALDFSLEVAPAQPERAPPETD